jgi:pyruvate/2-oxoglutarate dehydrogenase complex dihydrolipoamide dehydrogenase (E3) component
VFVAIGRVPNVAGMDLESANIAYSTETGIEINDKLQTTNKNVYAVGDC